MSHESWRILNFRRFLEGDDHKEYINREFSIFQIKYFKTSINYRCSRRNRFEMFIIIVFRIKV